MTKRVKNAVLASVVGADNNLLSDLIENADTLGIKQTVNGLMGSAINLVAMEKTPYDLAKPLNKAVRALVEMRRLNQNYKDWKAQQTFAFASTDDSDDAVAERLLELLATTKGSQQLKEIFDGYTRLVRNIGDTNTGNLFGDAPDVRGQLLERVAPSLQASNPKPATRPSHPQRDEPPAPVTDDAQKLIDAAKQAEADAGLPSLFEPSPDRGIMAARSRKLELQDILAEPQASPEAKQSAQTELDNLPANEDPDVLPLNPAQDSTVTQNAQQPSTKLPVATHAQRGTERNLVAVHNISAHKLRKAFKIGGLAVPSLAVIRTDRSEYDSFGNITLVAPPSLVDPQRGAKIVNSDAYSPRYPEISHGVTKQTEKTLHEIATKAINTLPDVHRRSFSPYRVLSDMPREDLRESLIQSEEMMLAYLVEKNQVPKLIVAKGDMAAYHQSQMDKSAIRNAVKAEGTKKLKDFERWVDDLIKTRGLEQTERIFTGYTSSGDRRYVAHTLENVVRIMKKKFRNGEGFNYGVGNIRARVAKGFRSLSGIKAERDKIIHDKQMEALKKEVDDEFDKLAQEVMPVRRVEGDSAYTTFADDLTAMAEGDYRHIREQYGDHSEAIQAMADFLEKLRELPTEYFEAKVQRAVQFNEFLGAVVPKNTEPDLIRELERRGLAIHPYDPDVKGDRQQKILDAAGDVAVFEKGSDFARAGKIKFSHAQHFDAVVKQVAGAIAAKGWTADEVRAKLQSSDMYGISIAPYIQSIWNKAVELAKAAKLEAERDNTGESKLGPSGAPTGGGAGPVPAGPESELSGTGGGTGRAGRPPLRVADEHLIPRPRTYVGTDGFRSVLDEHQRLAVNLIIESFKRGDEGFVLADGVGVGNSFELLGAMESLRRLSNGKLLLIVPNTLKSQIKGGTGGFVKAAKMMGVPLSAFEIASYEDLRRGLAGKGDYAAAIFDEAHNLKNWESKKSLAARDVRAKYRIYCTATPTDRPVGLAYFAADVTGQSVETVMTQFGIQMVPKTGTDGRPILDDDGNPVVTPEPMDGLTWFEVQRNIIRFRQQLVKSGQILRREYPFYGKIRVSRGTLSEDQMRDLQKVADWWDQRIAQARGRYARNLKGQKLMEISRLAEAWKLADALAFIEDKLQDPNAKVTIIAEGVNPTVIKGLDSRMMPGLLGSLALKLSERNIPFARIYGNTDPSGEIAKFQAPIKGGRRPIGAQPVRVALMSPLKGGVGVDLDDQIGTEPRHVFIATMNFAGDAIHQMLGRFSRRDTKSPASVYFHFLATEADVRRERIARNKITTIESIVRGEDVDIARPLIGTDDEEGIVREKSPSFNRPSALQKLWDKYDDTGEYTIRDLVDAVDQLLVEEPNTPQADALEQAVRDYRDAVREDRQEWGERGGLSEDAEEMFAAAVKSALAGKPFALQSESIEEKQAREEMEAVAKQRRADRENLEAQINRKLTGTTGDLGQKDMFGGDDLFAREPEGEFNRRKIEPWPEDFPRLVQMTNASTLTSHPDYDAAKHGDRDAAARVVNDVIKPDKLREIAKNHPNAVIVFVHAEEAAGRNALPMVFANAFSAITGLPTIADIVQSTEPDRTGKGNDYRMAFRPKFDGPVEAGRDYILVDDLSAMGGTFGELRYHIETNGGKVVAVTSLAGGRVSHQVAMLPETKLALEQKYGIDSLRELTRELGLYDGQYEALTEREAGWLLARSGAYEARDRIAAARRAGGVGLLQKNVRPSVSDQSASGRETDAPVAQPVTPKRDPILAALAASRAVIQQATYVDSKTRNDLISQLN